MKNPQDVVLQPLITEKSTSLRETKGYYCFKVHPKANKVEIARAIERLFANRRQRGAAEYQRAVIAIDSNWPLLHSILVMPVRIEWLLQGCLMIEV